MEFQGREKPSVCSLTLACVLSAQKTVCSLWVRVKSETTPFHPARPLTGSAVLENVKDPLRHFEFPVIDIGKQLAYVSKDNLPFDQSCTRLKDYTLQ